MTRKVVSSDEAPAAVGPYSQGIAADGFVFTAGQLGIVPGTMEFAGPDIEGQTRQALQNIEAVLTAAGSCLEHVVKTTVYLQDMGEFSRMNAVYAEFFSQSPPARSAFQVAALPLGGRVEIEAIAEACGCNADDESCSCGCAQD